MEKQILPRHIGLFALTLYGVGDILGAGIYGLVGKAAGEMGNAVWIAFVTSMVAAGLTGLSYASLGSRFAKAGGASSIVHRAYRKDFLAYVIGLCVLASGLTSMATASRVFSGYLHGLLPSVPIELTIILFTLALTVIVFWGLRESMWVNSLCTLVEVSGLIFILVVGISFWGGGDYFDAVTPQNPSGDISPSLILTGAVLTFYSFIGFEDTLNVAEEVRDPFRTLPKALLLAIAISSVIYIGISITAVSVIPAQVLANSPQPLVEVVRVAAPWFPPHIFNFVAMFAVANTALLNFIMGSRLIYGMASHKLLPSAGAKIHAVRKTPYVAILFIAAILLTLALSGDISSLAKATSVLLLITFSFVNIGLFILKKRRGEETGLFEIPSFIPILAATICLAMLFSAKTKELTVAGIILLIIFGLYFFVRPSRESLKDLDV